MWYVVVLLEHGTVFCFFKVLLNEYLQGAAFQRVTGLWQSLNQVSFDFSGSNPGSPSDREAGSAGPFVGLVRPLEFNS